MDQIFQYSWVIKEKVCGKSLMNVSSYIVCQNAWKLELLIPISLFPIYTLLRI